jgi:hypothetical protein
MQFPAADIVAAVRIALGGRDPMLVDATQLATALMGDAIAANRFIPGSAFSFLYSFFHTVQLFAIFPSLAFPILLLSIFHTGISPILLSFQF